MGCCVEDQVIDMGLSPRVAQCNDPFRCPELCGEVGVQRERQLIQVGFLRTSEHHVRTYPEAASLAAYPCPFEEGYRIALSSLRKLFELAFVLEEGSGDVGSREELRHNMLSEFFRVL